MKKMLLLAMICLNSIVSAQKNYELFSFESKNGVVETNSLDEFIAPTFPDYSRTFDAIGLVDGSKYTFVDRKTGDTETLLFNGDRLRFNGNYYQHFSKDGKSVFISKEVKNRIQFDKNYSAAIGDGSNLYVKHDGLFEVFASPNFAKPKLKNINAKKIYLDYLFRKKTNNEENLVVFLWRRHYFSLRQIV